MGGSDLGNRRIHHGPKATVSEVDELAIADVRKHIVKSGADSVTFRKSFVQCDRTKDLAVKYTSLTIPLTWLACTYGSQRPWFVYCGCGQWVAKLYQHWSTTRYDDWLCRRCLDLTYESCQKSNSDDAVRHRREQAIAKFRRAIGDTCGVSVA